MENELKRPGGEIANRPLHFFWVVDCSGSMAGEKIGAVNHAIQETIEPMKEEAANNPNAQLCVRTLKFSTGASWVEEKPIPIEEFVWNDLKVDEYAVTDLGTAFERIAMELEMPPMPKRALPPVIVLLSDGCPTDDWKKPLEKLQNMPWGRKAVKVAIAIGKNAERSVLEAFTGNCETVFDANNPETLVHLIKWASTIASEVSKPLTKPNDQKQDSDAPGEKTDSQDSQLPDYITPPDLKSIDAPDVF